MSAYKRIQLKLNGESLMGENNYGIDTNRLNEYARIAGMVIIFGLLIWANGNDIIGLFK